MAGNDINNIENYKSQLALEVENDSYRDSYLDFKSVMTRKK